MEGEGLEDGIRWKSQYKYEKKNQLIKGFVFKEVPRKKEKYFPLVRKSTSVKGENKWFVFI